MSSNQSIFGRSIPEKPSMSGKQSLTGRPSMVGRLSTGRQSLARQSLAGHGRTLPGSQMRRKAGLSLKDVKEYSATLREFVSNHNVFNAEPAIVSKDFNYATELNFLDYLQIIIYQIAEDYQCTKLEKDLNFWLSAFGMDTLQPTMFSSLRNNWKYVVEGLVKLIKVIDCCDEVEKCKEGDDGEGISFESWNDANFLELFFTTIENMNGSDRCLPEHYQEGLKNYMDEYVKYTSDVGDDIGTLREKVEFLRRKKNDLDGIRAEIEKEKYSVEKMEADYATLTKYSNDLNKDLSKLKDLAKQLDEACNKNQEEVEKAHEKWMKAINNVTNQRFSKEEARQYSVGNAAIASQIQSIEQDIKLLEEEYSKKLAETSGLLKAVENSSSKLISRVRRLDVKTGGGSLFLEGSFKTFDVFGDIDALSKHYDNYMYPAVEELFKNIDLVCSRKKEEAIRAEKDLSETIAVYQKLLGDYSKLEIRNQDLKEMIKVEIQKMEQQHQHEIEKKERIIKEIEWVENFSSNDKCFGIKELQNEIDEYKERSRIFIDRKKEKLTEKINADLKNIETIKVIKNEISRVLEENRRVFAEINDVNSDWSKYVSE